MEILGTHGPVLGLESSQKSFSKPLANANSRLVVPPETTWYGR